MKYDLCVIFEHPEWQIPLFNELERRGINFTRFDLKKNAFDPSALPDAKLYFNQASPSAYKRGNPRAVPLAYSFIRSLEHRGATVLNGSSAFGLELSKSAQIALCHALGIRFPKTIAFNDVESVISNWSLWPCLIKPEQGGSGARMFQVNTPDELRGLLATQPELWFPDQLLLLQELIPVDPTFGIVRMEFLGGELLYAMRVVSNGSFNLCPSEVCNPSDGTEGQCEIPTATPVEFYAYPEISSRAVEVGKQIVKTGNMDVAGIEFIVGDDGEPIVYDINANSNLRPAIAAEFGFDPFSRVVDFLENEIERI